MQKKDQEWCWHCYAHYDSLTNTFYNLNVIQKLQGWDSDKAGDFHSTMRLNIKFGGQHGASWMALDWESIDYS